MSGSGANYQLRLRFLREGQIALGPGKIDLLEAIGSCGSISRAARQMGMSYRRAWLLINTMNQCFATPLVETSKGGEKGGGAVLSPLGREVLERYRAIEARMLEAAEADIEALRKLIL